MPFPPPSAARPATYSFSALLVFSLLSGCTPELGPCDEVEALRLAYDEAGSPAFEGQALMIRSCGFGAFCHSENINPADRYGTPRGLAYDLRLTDRNDSPAEGVARLEEMHRRTFADRHEIWATVQRGRMPVGGRVGRDIDSAAPVYSRIAEDGTLEPVAGLDTAEGQATLRNWLACGLPIVQSTTRNELDEPIGYVVDALEVEPVRPEWPDIYSRLIEPRCASAPCHGEAIAGDLDLRGLQQAHSAMVGITSASEGCGNSGGVLIEPGAADVSVLIWKLEGRDADGETVCGDLMPIGLSRVSEASIASIREWIAGGASLE